MAGATALHRRLESDGEPLVKRLRFAQNAIQIALPIPRKDEVIMEWLCKVGEKLKKRSRRESITHSNEDVSKLWTTLETCLSALHKQVDGVHNLRQSTLSNIVKVLSKHLERSDLPLDERVLLLKCCSAVLKNHSFQKYFFSNIPSFSTFSCTVIKSLFELDRDHVKVCSSVVSSIHAAVRHNWTITFCLKFRPLFLDDILVPLIMLFKFQEKENSDLMDEITKFITMVLFTKKVSDFKDLFKEMSAKKHNTEDENYLSNLEIQHPIPFQLWKVFRDSKKTLDSNSFVNLFSLVFRSCVYSCSKGDSDSMVFQMTVVLSYFVGFEIKNPNCKVPYSKLKELFGEPVLELSTVSVEVFSSMVKSLTELYPSLTGEISKFSFIDWFKMLVANIFPLASSLAVDVKFLKFMSDLMMLNPFILETSVRKVLGAIFARPFADGEKSEYSIFLSNLFSTFVKLRRVPAFLKAYISCLNDALKNQDVSANFPSGGDVWLPNQVTEAFSQFATTESSLTSIEILKLLVSDLSQNCLETYQQEVVPTKNACKDTVLQCVSDLLCAFLRGVRLLDHCQSLQSRQSLCSILAELKVCLHSFGLLLLDDSKANESVAASFFNLSYSWGAVALLVELYADVGRDDLISSLGTNLKAGCENQTVGAILSLLHPYLTSDEWTRIYNLANTFENKICKDLLVKFDVQLLSSIKLSNSPALISKEVAKRVCNGMVQKLTVEGDTSFIDHSALSDMILIVPLLDISDFKDLLDGLANCLVSISDSVSFFNITALLREERSMTCGIICSVLNNLRRVLKASKRKRNEAGGKLWKTSKAVLGKWDDEIIFQGEIKRDHDSSERLASLLSPMASIVEEALKSHSAEEQVAVEESELAKVLQHLHVLQSLPLACLSGHSQALVFISVLSLALDCCVLPASQSKDSILKAVFDHLLLGLYERGKIESPKLENCIDHGILLNGLAPIAVNFNVGHRLLVLLLGQAVHQDQLQDQILDKIVLLSKRSSKQEPGKEDLLLGTLLLQELSPTSLQISTDSRLESARKKLVRSFEALFQHQLIKPEEWLHAYALTLGAKLVTNDNVDTLLPSLGNLLNKAASFLKSDKITEQNTAETLILLIFEHRHKLGDSIPSSFFENIWSVLLSLEVPSKTLLTTLYMHATKNEMSTIVENLLLATPQVYNEEKLSEKYSPNMIQFWLLLLQCPHLPSETYKISVKGIVALLDHLPSIKGLPHLQLLEFLSNVFSSSKVAMDKNVIDQCILILHGVSLPDTAQEFIPIANQYLPALSTLFMRHTAILMDLIPSFMQLLILFIKKLGYVSQQKFGTSPADADKLAKLAFGVEK
ncbi:hypothetical protein ONE63_004234 [Megalurothrips usitatus]|uniref:Unhealthy ribosome biogenesis protein 2 homolog n=1 Tax=Megalurothrips usitatus TaxID=439358 RepID=A0AAV7X265_9NEOP|nr:hypothetical protein ONE63_004234 [Megalurothrips usitatus]